VNWLTIQSATRRESNRSFDAQGGRKAGMNPLESIGGSIAAGIVLAVVLVYVIKALAGG
jgi:hypothetical protein